MRGERAGNRETHQRRHSHFFIGRKPGQGSAHVGVVVLSSDGRSKVEKRNHPMNPNTIVHNVASPNGPKPWWSSRVKITEECQATYQKK